MTKKILMWSEAREKILEWMKAVAEVVVVTMWPKWRNVILEKPDWNPLITNDWVTIAREIELEWKFENMWAKLVIEAAMQTNSQAWDWTTTATLLTYEIAKEGLKYLKAWVNAVELKNWIKKASVLVIEELEKMSKKISSREEILWVANISAGNTEIWDIIADAMEKVGESGVISIEDWQTFGLELEVTEWMQIESGYISPYMVTNPEKMLSELEQVPVLITDKKINNMKEIIPIFEKLVASGKKDLVIIAEDVSGDALTGIVMNNLKWILNILAIKAPSIWENKKEILKDIAILTWANFVKEELWMKLENIVLEDLWWASKIISTKEKTTIINGFWNSENIALRVRQIKQTINESDSDFNKQEFIKRLAKLDSGVAVIKVWAASNTEMMELKLRIEDALNATRAATLEWIVAGWWIAFLRAKEVLEGVSFWNSDSDLWIEILKKTLGSATYRIAKNAWKNPSEIIEKILESDNKNFWYDASTDSFVDMLKEGIIDPTRVERVALEEAVSLAWMFLTTESAIVLNREKVEK